MAEVYRAYHVSLDRYVAIKVLHSFLADDPEFKSRFEREAHAISAGSTEFDIALSAGLGPGNTGASEDWLAYWRTMAQDGADISWLRLHLAHIYGAPAAERLLTPYPW